MKALTFSRYGSPEVLKLEDIPRPVPGADDVLIRIRAVSVNSWDWDWLTGKPMIYRLLFGLFRPRIRILGCDISGTIEATGDAVEGFTTGDDVFGDISQVGWGGFAEYVCAKAAALAPKPPEISHTDAAALPQAGVLALQGFRQGGLKPGKKVLINGAGGGVGTIGLQIAKHEGAEVACVDRGNKLDMLRALGADQVIDCTREDFTRLGHQYDLILDNVCRHTESDYRKCLRPGGCLVIIGGKPGRILRTVLLGKILGGSRRMTVLMHQPNPSDLRQLAGFMADGKLKPVIDDIYALEQTPDALRRVGEGKVRGKAVIRIG